MELCITPPELPHGKTHHVFLSYATIDHDKQLAQYLCHNLSKLDYKCFIHEIEFIAGKLIQENIAIGLKRSLKTILVLSENYNRSFWCQIEMDEIVQLHKEHLGFPPIILKTDNCEVPSILRSYTYLALERGLEHKMDDIIGAINDLEPAETVPLVHIPFVPLPCLNYYQGTQHYPCIWPHVCAKFILSDNACDGSCRENHVIDEDSMTKLKKCGFPVEMSPDKLLALYREKCRMWLHDFPSKTITGPCFYYNKRGCFMDEQKCPFTHICVEWFHGTCKRDPQIGLCPYSHDILNSQTEKLLQTFDIDTSQPKDVILQQYREKCPEYSFSESLNHDQERNCSLSMEIYIEPPSRIRQHFKKYCRYYVFIIDIIRTQF